MISRSPIFLLCSRFVGATWVVVGFIMILICISRVILGWSSSSWPHVSGKIIESRMIPVKNTSGKVAFYNIRIVYAYSPPSSEDGFTSAFQNTTISSCGFVDPSQNSYYSPVEAKRLISQYSTGKQVQVYYNPSEPKVALLHPGADIGTFSGCLIGFTIVVLGILLLVFIPSFINKRLLAVSS